MSAVLAFSAGVSRLLRLLYSDAGSAESAIDALRGRAAAAADCATTLASVGLRVCSCSRKEPVGSSREQYQQRRRRECR
jgi:hypothetical protein